MHAVRSAAAMLAVVLVTACKQAPAPRSRIERDHAGDTDTGDAQPFAPPDVALIRYACLGFDAAVEAHAPHNRLLSHSAAHAIELGGPAIEHATRRWALMPPQGLLEEIERYEQDTEVSPETCAGLRAHLERMAMISASH